MKRKLLLILPALLLLLSACKKSDIPEARPWPLSAQPAAEAVNAGFSWVAGDVLSANTSLSRPLEAGGTLAAEFLFNDYDPLQGERVNVLFPGNAAQVVDIPTVQEYAGTAAPAAAMPLWGTLVAPGADATASVTLQPLYSRLQFRITGTGTVYRIVIRAEGNELLSGTFKMGYEAGAFNGRLLGGNSVELDLRFPNGVTLSESGTVITAPVLAGNYTQGFSVKFCNAAGRYSLAHFEESGLSLTPGQTKELPAVAFRPDLAEEGLDDYTENTLFDPGRLIAGSYNILAITSRKDNCPDNAWNTALPTLVSIINAMDCDILTLNELEATEIADLQASLRRYAWVLKKNYRSSYSYAPGIIYKAARFEKLADGIFWLSYPNTTTLVTVQSEYSYTDPVDGKEYAAGSNRCCVWAKFRDNISGKSFYWFAPHPTIRGTDAQSSLANTPSCLNAGNIRSLLAQIPLVNTEGLPAVIAGDMNSWSGHVSIPLFGEAGWTNAYETALAAGLIDGDAAMRPGTDIGYLPDNYQYGENRRIDHIFYKGLSVRSYQSDFTRYNNPVMGPVYPSDHIPIKTILSF